MNETKIMVVDDDIEMCRLLDDYLSAAGYVVSIAESGAACLQMASAESFDLVLTDLRMDGMDGLELTRRLVEASPATPVVMMTAFGSIDTAIEAIKNGAANFITKPFKMGSLKVILEQALTQRHLEEENKRLHRELTERYSFSSLVGGSASMREVYDMIERVADTASNVLILGESGTGKELVARAIHFSGPRGHKAFVPINCTSLPENLLESELFGHVKGAFTGAAATKKGLVEAADGGSLFLDEIGDLEPSLQAKLLRLLEERDIRPVGAVTSRKVDVRVIAATHRHLAHEVESGSFREDLFFRLNVITIRLPPLRERRDDIPPLIDHFLKKHSDRLKRPVMAISDEAVAGLVERPWRGNVRELENAIERALVLVRGTRLEVSDFSDGAQETLFTKGVEVFIQGRPTLEELENRYIDLVLDECDGDKAKAADRLGISTRTLYRRDKR